MCFETFFLIASVSNVPKGLMGKERNKIKDWFVYRNLRVLIIRLSFFFFCQIYKFL